jgi:hypothetical protein
MRNNRRRGITPFGCAIAVLGCGVVTLVSVLLAYNFLPVLAAQAMGFTARGSTADVFADVTPAPIVEIYDAVQPEQVTVDLSGVGSQTVSGDSAAYQIASGYDAANAPTTLVYVDEAGLYAEICLRAPTACNGTNAQYRISRVDFQPGGAIIYADVSLGGLTQRVGAVVLITASNFQVVGVDVNGMLFSDPPGELAGLVNELEQRGNQVLRDFTLTANGMVYSLSEVIIDHTTMTLVLR